MVTYFGLYFALSYNEKAKTIKSKANLDHGIVLYQIDALLPNLLPYSESTAEQFDKRGWVDQIWITLKESNYLPAGLEGWFNKLKHRFEIVGISDEAPGLVHVIDHRGPIEKNNDSFSDLYFKSTDDFKDYFYIRCNKKVEGRYPSCTVHTKYKNLKLIKLVSDFEVTGE